MIYSSWSNLEAYCQQERIRECAAKGVLTEVTNKRVPGSTTMTVLCSGWCK